jgi:predicted RNA-binding protein YlqC (UPF0109 family)
MQAFLKYILEGLVQHPGEVSVTPVERGGQTVFEVRVNPADAGRVIGRQGQTINAIRTLLQAGSAKQGLRCTLDLVDDRPAQ